MALDPVLRARLVHLYADEVFSVAQLPAARRDDVEAAPEFSRSDDELVCTCTITGSTYSIEWDGREESAEAFAVEVGQDTGNLVRRTKKNHRYAWLYATR